MKKINAKRATSVALAAAMVLGCVPANAAEEAGTYTVETTADGWIKVTNSNGKVLGYSEESGVAILEDNGYAFKDMNKNGSLDVYEDWRQDYETRAADLVAQAEIEDIAGILMAAGGSTFPGAIADYLTDGTIEVLDKGIKTFGIMGGMADKKTLAIWNNLVQEYSEGSSFGIPVVFTEDTVFERSGWSNSLGLAASFDTELAAKVGEAQSIEDRLVGRTVTMGLQVDLATDPRWRRDYQTLGEDPALASDMAVAYVNASQSTYDEEGNDLGWGAESVINQVKHFPGDGTGEGGRESHNDYGKYAVYPGGQFYTQLIPFISLLDLPGATESAASIMPSYSIAYSADGEYGELVGSSFSEFKVQEILRDNLNYDGYLSTDWMVASQRIWGVENMEPAERVLKVWEAGGDQIAVEGDIQLFLDAYALGCEKYGEEEFRTRINESAARVVKASFQTQLFDNPYIDTERTVEVIEGEEHTALKLEQNLKSIVMLKNAGNVIHDTSAETEKPTVYVPMVYTAPKTGYMASSGGWGLPFDETLASEYLNIVTDKVSDTLTGEPDKDGNPTVGTDDIIRATAEELAECDYALVMVTSPATGTGDGYDAETGEYLPISLQYSEYTADSESVRKSALANGEVEVVEETYYGPMTTIEKENRSYYGKSVTVNNTTNLDTILYAAENMPEDASVIVAVNATNPMVFAEFEDQVDAIVIGFGSSEQAFLEIATGKTEPSALLPMQMPANMETVEAQYEDVPRDMECHVDTEGNAYDFAYGLNWSGVIKDERTEKYDVEPLVGTSLE